MVEIIIDERKIQTRPGDTVLNAAQRAGVFIPTLCHNDSVKPYSACRMCMVEVTQNGRTKLVTSCDYPVSNNLKVKTNTPRLKRNRKMILELLMARSPESPALIDMAKQVGLDHEPRFKAQNFDDCIMCGLCVRVCNEVVGASAIGFENRGPARRVVPPFDMENPECIACGACAQVCPVSVIDIFEHAGIRELPRWHKKAKLVKCRSCGRYFATEEELEMVRKKTKLSEDALHTCPDCRTYSFKV